jgi:hypothetical protein
MITTSRPKVAISNLTKSKCKLLVLTSYGGQSTECETGVSSSDGDYGDEDFQKRNGCLISLPLVLLGLSDDVLSESFSSSTEY